MRLMQAGMFAPAESLCSELCDFVFTHFKREEDVTRRLMLPHGCDTVAR